uniref:Uncharacterized protein n=1 Tax=Setaria italica TaxID=4555 RepID=K3XNK0_SETIT
MGRRRWRRDSASDAGGDGARERSRLSVREREERGRPENGRIGALNRATRDLQSTGDAAAFAGTKARRSLRCPPCTLWPRDGLLHLFPVRSPTSWVIAV